ncbi:MAG: hypothetical protein RSG77_21800 [Hafnia sp.]
MSFKYLMPEHCRNMHNAVNEMLGVIAVAKSIQDAALSESIITKIQLQIDELHGLYGEIHNDDGTVLVKHPAIGFVTVEERLCEEPVRLFASKVKSLSTNRVCLYRADALVDLVGNVSYVNRKLLVDVEMTQMAYAALLANPGRGHYAATIRKLGDVAVTYDGDLNGIRGKLMFEESQNVTEGMAKWAQSLVSVAQQAADKGGLMSKAARAKMDQDASVLSSWTASNPEHYATVLADFTSSTSTDMKMEVLSAAKIKGAH